MKVLIIFALTIISFNSFAGSAKVGEDLKSECKHAVQAGRRSEPKPVTEPVAPVKEEKKEGTKAV